LKHKASVRGKIFGEGGAAAPAARAFTRERALVPYRESDGDDELRQYWSRKTLSWAAI